MSRSRVRVPLSALLINIMITSEIVKIKFVKDNTLIEAELKKLGIEPLRWAVVAVEKDELLISVSYEY